MDDEGAVDAEKHDEEAVLLRGAAGDSGVGGVGEVVVPGEGEDVVARHGVAGEDVS